MKFRTIVDIPHSIREIDWNSRIQLYGSCFVESIGQKLSNIKATVECNPFGVLYNPISIKQGIDWLMEGKPIGESDIVERENLYHSLLHHSSFSSNTHKELVERVTAQAVCSREFLERADWLIVTFGSAYVYRYKETGKVVSNCHKLPDSFFFRERLTVSEIVDEWGVLIEMLRQSNPQLNLLFTVSPIRHWKDGAHNNQLSKSTLLLAIAALCDCYPNCCYFPSYELIMDELRDYRFYQEDMNHPSDQAVDYVWERFVDTFFSPLSRGVIDEWNKLLKSITHRPLNAKGDSYRAFNAQTLLKLTSFKKKYPYFDVRKEISILEERLK